MNLTEVMMFVTFFLYIAIFLVTLYNIFSMGKFYNTKIVWILFAVYLILYLVGMTVVMTQDTSAVEVSELVPSLFNIQVWLLEGYFVMLVIQLIMQWKNESIKPIEARRSNEERR